MKRKLTALTIASLCGAASAQSSVTLTGVVDTSVTQGRGSIADRTQLTSGSNSTSRLILRGREDLGNGMAASFWLEGQLSTDDGMGVATNTNNQASGAPAAGAVPPGAQGFMFNRKSTVSLSGPWGEARLGRDFVPQYMNRTLFDVFGASGVGATIIHNLTITGVTSIRAANTIGYFLPSNLAGLYGQAQYYLGENLDNVGATRKDGSGYGLRLGYATGPVSVAVATGRTRYAVNGVRQSNVGGQWELPLVKLMGQYERESAGARDGSGWQLGGIVPVGSAGEVKLSYSTFRLEPVTGVGLEARSSKLAVGYVHNFSKRTAVYATYASVRNKNGAAFALAGAVTGANRGSSGIDLGIRHTF